MSDVPAGREREPSEPTEWELASIQLRAPGELLAVVDVASDAPVEAEAVILRIRELVGDEQVRVFDARAAEDVSALSAWLTAHTGPGRVLVVHGLAGYAHDRESARGFWSWAELQRERWLRPDTKVVLLLTPSQVDDARRYAPMLWDWILAHWDMRPRQTGLGALVSRPESFMLGREDDPRRARERLPTLREQLVHARQRGLDKAVIKEHYAWPLFRALVQAGELAQARSILGAELGPGFAGELPAHRAPYAWQDLGAYYGALRDWENAERAFRAVMDGFRGLGSEEKTDIAGGNLGRVLAMRGDLDGAEALSKRVLERAKQSGDVRGMGVSYYHLAVIVHSRGDLERAEAEYLRSLELLEASGDRVTMGRLYRHLGTLAFQRGDLDAAQTWYQKALEAAREQGDESLSTSTYRLLGVLALERADHAQADSWYQRALVIQEALGMVVDAAMTRELLAGLAAREERWDDAADHLLRASSVYQGMGDEAQAQRVTRSYRRFCEHAAPATRARLLARWREAGLDEAALQ